MSIQCNFSVLERRTFTFIMNVLLKFFASSSYNIIYIYANEIFPTNIRNTGMGICSMIARKDLFCVSMIPLVQYGYFNN